jgi:hypothetical protein
MAYRPDDVDLCCEIWARQWVRNFVETPVSMPCTLGKVQNYHNGAAYWPALSQPAPEVFVKSGLIVSTALKMMRPSQSWFVHNHYIGRWYCPTWVNTRDGKQFVAVRLKRPLRQALMAERMGIGVREYYLRRDTAKECIRAALYPPVKGVASDACFW